MFIQYCLKWKINVGWVCINCLLTGSDAFLARREIKETDSRWWRQNESKNWTHHYQFIISAGQQMSEIYFTPEHEKENIEDTGLILIENCLIRKLINCQLSWISLFATTLTACLKSWLAECKPLSDVGLVTWYVFMEVTWPVGCTMKNSLGGGNH